MCQFLADQDEGHSYFGQHLESGSHRKAVQMVIAGQADVAAIDSTILDFELARRPELKHQIRLLGSLGPSPVPPWVVSNRLPAAQRQEIRNFLLGMVNIAEGKFALEEVGLKGFVQVEDAGYDAIRRVARLVDE
jgi:phosphonate transport system substrate-binding protein